MFYWEAGGFNNVIPLNERPFFESSLSETTQESETGMGVCCMHTPFTSVEINTHRHPTEDLPLCSSILPGDTTPSALRPSPSLAGLILSVLLSRVFLQGLRALGNGNPSSHWSLVSSCILCQQCSGCLEGERGLIPVRGLRARSASGAGARALFPVNERAALGRVR